MSVTLRSRSHSGILATALVIQRIKTLPPTLIGMLLMLVSTLAFTGMQASIRIVASDAMNPLPPAEVAFFRNLFGLLALAPLFFRYGPAPLKTRRIRLHLLRAGLQAGGMLCFFTAVTMIPLAEITALSFSAPLFATVLAIFLLGERVRRRRMTALALGFLGVLVVLRPGAEALSTGALLVLGSSLGWAAAMTMIKSLSRTDSAFALTFYAALFMTPLTFVPAAFEWTHPTLGQLSWLVVLGSLGTAGHLAFAQALKIAEMSAVLPLDFLRLVWASMIGILVFGEIPTVWSLVGGAMIFGGASYIAFRESQLSRERKERETTTLANEPATSATVRRSQAVG